MSKKQKQKQNHNVCGSETIYQADLDPMTIEFKTTVLCGVGGIVVNIAAFQNHSAGPAWAWLPPPSPDPWGCGALGP